MNTTPCVAFGAFPLLPQRYAMREVGRPQRGGAALARRLLANAAFAPHIPLHIARR